MCTLTFIPSEKSYLVGMNRDEQLSRAPALPPTLFRGDDIQALYPHESSGGTWIACNSFGNTLALLNWYSTAVPFPPEKKKTRGFVIQELILKPNLSAMKDCFSNLDFKSVFPFRLVGFFSYERIIQEWRWDGIEKTIQQFPWTRRHWFSSSLSDLETERERGTTCDVFAANPAVLTKEWLRALHSSHYPGPGPFSICVHRDNVGTVSYTEIELDDSAISMSYLAGSPCTAKPSDSSISIPFHKQHRPTTIP